MATNAVGVLGQLALHALQSVQHVASVMQQAFTSGGQGHATAVAVEQRGIDGRFQIRQAFADSRGGNVFALSSAANAAQFAHGDEQLQRGQVNTTSKTAFGILHGGVNVFSLLVLRS